DEVAVLAGIRILPQPLLRIARDADQALTVAEVHLHRHAEPAFLHHLVDLLLLVADSVPASFLDDDVRDRDRGAAARRVARPAGPPAGRAAARLLGGARCGRWRSAGTRDVRRGTAGREETARARDERQSET